MGRVLGWRLDKKLDEREREKRERMGKWDDFRISIVVFATFHFFTNNRLQLPQNRSPAFTAPICPKEKELPRLFVDLFSQGRKIGVKIHGRPINHSINLASEACKRTGSEVDFSKVKLVLSS